MPPSVLLDAQGRATAVLRSAGTGTATIAAAGGTWGPGTATVGFSFPLRFVSVTLAGAIAGWLVRQRQRAPTVQSCLVALIFASILGFAYAIGIHWLQWAPETALGEGLPFLVAAMGASSGLKALTDERPDSFPDNRVTTLSAIARDSATLIVASAIRRMAEAAERAIEAVEKAE
jgi:hypothetical protein